jgi:bifunctional lysine-specific demethylase and histidyl-hydroxylase NO66
MSVLPLLVDDPAVLADHWEREPLVSAGPRDLGEVFSLETVERLIDSGTLPLPCIRLVRDGTELPARRSGRRAERNPAARERLVDAAAVRTQIAAGATLIVEELQTYSPEVAAFAGALSAETGYATYCAAFVTPPGSRGVAPHYDQVSVFIRQVHGSKRWLISRPVERWPTQGWSAGQDVDTETVLDVVLEAGQCLYVPRGFVHAGTATASASAHLSIGMVPPTWASVLRRLTDAALDAEPLREALPLGFPAMDPARLRSLLAERVAEFTARFDALASGPDADLALNRARPRPAPAPPEPGSLRAVLTGPPS